MVSKSHAKLHIILVFLLLLGLACSFGAPMQSGNKSVPHESRWGIFSLNLNTESTELVYSSTWELTGLRLSPDGNRIVFSQKIGGKSLDHDEICIVGVDGTNFTRLTQNHTLDTYPAWSPDGTKIAFLAMQGDTLDIYIMNVDGSGQNLLYDSGFHDGDILDE